MNDGGVAGGDGCVEARVAACVRNQMAQAAVEGNFAVGIGDEAAVGEFVFEDFDIKR